VRLGTGLGKYWVCKRMPQHVAEAMECIGGSGVMEDSPMPRLFRESPVNAIWEGSGNIQCLDVLRALAKEPDTGEALLAELLAGSGIDADFDAAFADAQVRFAQGVDEAGARAFVERLALLLQAAVLLRAGNPLAAAYCRSRLGDGRGATYGTLASDIDGDAAIARIFPD